MPTKRILTLGIETALSSKEVFRVGAVLYKGPSILRAAPNTGQYIGYRKTVFEFTPTRHAEINAMHGIPRDILSTCDMLVVRVTRRDKLTCAKPCRSCMMALKQAGIRRVFYTNYTGALERLDIKTIDMSKYSKDRMTHDDYMRVYRMCGREEDYDSDYSQ